MRNLELAAIAPDIFDITYYSIEPYFGAHYLKRIQNGIAAKFNVTGAVQRVRGDLGWAENNPQLNKFSVKDQIEVAGGSPGQAPPYDTEKIFFTVLDPNQLLTSWTEDSLLDYSMDKAVTKFGKCFASPNIDPNNTSPNQVPTTSGNCVAGGRTGFSVKLVSERFLTDPELPLGGSGIRGAILNPPPANF